MQVSTRAGFAPGAERSPMVVSGLLGSTLHRLLRIVKAVDAAREGVETLDCPLASQLEKTLAGRRTTMNWKQGIAKMSVISGQDRTCLTPGGRSELLAGRGVP